MTEKRKDGPRSCPVLRDRMELEGVLGIELRTGHGYHSIRIVVAEVVEVGIAGIEEGSHELILGIGGRRLGVGIGSFEGGRSWRCPLPCLP